MRNSLTADISLCNIFYKHFHVWANYYKISTCMCLSVQALNAATKLYFSTVSLLLHSVLFFFFFFPFTSVCYVYLLYLYCTSDKFKFLLAKKILSNSP